MEMTLTCGTEFILILSIRYSLADLFRPPDSYNQRITRITIDYKNRESKPPITRYLENCKIRHSESVSRAPLKTHFPQYLTLRPYLTILEMVRHDFGEFPIHEDCSKIPIGIKDLSGKKGGCKVVLFGGVVLYSRIRKSRSF